MINQIPQRFLIRKRCIILAIILGMVCNIAIAQTDQKVGEARKRIEPEGFLYGIGLGIKREIYQGFDQRNIIIPFIGYRGDKLRVFGPFVSYDFLQIDGFNMSLQARAIFEGYEESDSDVFTGMEEREASIYLGLGLNYTVENWKFQLSAGQDALSRSDGFKLNGNLGKVFRQGIFFIEPAVGFNFLDSRHVDYYYGVESTEATSERNAFEGEDALNATLALSLITPAFFDGLTTLKIENKWFDDNITDSPLTDKDSSLSLFFSFSKFF